MEALESWWMMRSNELVKLHNWTAQANGNDIVEAEVKTLPDPVREQ